MLKKIFAACLSSFIFMFSALPAFAENKVVVSAGTIVPLAFVGTVNSNDLAIGDIVSVKITNDIKQDGNLVFKSGDNGVAYIKDVKHARHHGGAGYIEIKAVELPDVTGHTHNLQFNVTEAGQNHRPSAIFASVFGTFFILVPFGCWMQGEPAVISSTKVINAIVTTPIEIKEGL